MSSNPASVLDSVKKSLGFESEYEAFDPDVIMIINSAFGSLQQLAVGPKTGFAIIDNSLMWSDYTSQVLLLGMVKQFVYMTSRLGFDPPATSFGIDAIKTQIAELTWRLNVMAEEITPPSNPDGSSNDSDVIAQAYWWDLTGLSDFPDEAAIGDLGIDLDSGDVWRKAA